MPILVDRGSVRVESPVTRPENMLANKTGTITKGCAFKPQSRNMIAKVDTRRNRKVSNFIVSCVPKARAAGLDKAKAKSSFTIGDTYFSIHVRGRWSKLENLG